MFKKNKFIVIHNLKVTKHIPNQIFVKISKEIIINKFFLAVLRSFKEYFQQKKNTFEKNLKKIQENQAKHLLNQ